MASEPAPMMKALEQPRAGHHADQLVQPSVVRRRVVLATCKRNGSRVTVRLHDVVEMLPPCHDRLDARRYSNNNNNNNKNNYNNNNNEI
jgi:hypothetical protein